MNRNKPFLKIAAILFPALIVLSSLGLFVFLKLDLTIRLAILAADTVAALVVGVVLWRRSG